MIFEGKHKQPGEEIQVGSWLACTCLGEKTGRGVLLSD